MNPIEKIYIKNEQSMLEFGAKLSKMAKPGDVIFLQGELGAGKTTLTRGFLHALGYRGKVKSPTFTLVESYCFVDFTLHHFDLYRLENPHELEYLGLRDYLNEQSICLIEWPERASRLLPKPQIYCKIKVPDNSEGRLIELSNVV